MYSFCLPMHGCFGYWSTWKYLTTTFWNNCNVICRSGSGNTDITKSIKRIFHSGIWKWNMMTVNLIRIWCSLEFLLAICLATFYIGRRQWSYFNRPIKYELTKSWCVLTCCPIEILPVMTHYMMMFAVNVWLKNPPNI